MACLDMVCHVALYQSTVGKVHNTEADVTKWTIVAASLAYNLSNVFR